MATIEHFEVETDSVAYSIGSSVTGRVRLHTNKCVMASGVFLEAVGAAHCILEEQPPWEEIYYNRRMTLYGQSYRTEQGKWKHNELRFATKAAPDGGILNVPISKVEKKLQLHFVAVSHGEEHILGTTRLFPLSLIDNCRSRDRMDMPLTLDGSVVTAVVRFKASWHLTSSGDCQLVSWHGEKDMSRVVTFDIESVYPKEMPELNAPVESFYCKITAEAESQLTESRRLAIPPVDLDLPFTLQLPEYLPSSIDTDQGSSVRYSIACTLEDGDVELVSTVCHFSVFQPIPSSIPALATARRIQSTKRSWMICSRDAAIPMVTHIDRSGYAPGEPIHINLKGENTLKVPLDISVDLVRRHRLRTPQTESFFSTVFNLLPCIRVPHKAPFLFDWNLTFPVVAPSYEALDEDGDQEPMTWSYQFVVTVEARNRIVLEHRATVIATALPTEAFCETRGDRIHHSRLEAASRKPRETRLILGDWREAVAEGIDGALSFKPDPQFKAVRATNKAIRGGDLAEVSFIPQYSSASAVVSAAGTMIREF